MKGKVKGVQTRISEIESRAIYVHCLNHSLNLALQDSVKEVHLVRDTLQYVNNISVLIGRSAKRKAMFESIAKELQDEKVISLKALCPTRWSVRVSSLSSILQNYNSTLISLVTLGNSTDSCATTAKGLASQMEKFEFLFAIVMCIELFRPCESLASVLQQKKITMTGSLESAKAVLKKLKIMQSKEQFNRLWKECQVKAEEWELTLPKLPRQKRNPAKLKGLVEPSQSFGSEEEYYKSIYDKALQNLIQEIQQRFKQPGVKEICKLEQILCHMNFCSENIKVCEKFGIDPTKAQDQLEMFYQLKDNDKNVETAAKQFTTLCSETQSLLSEVKNIIKLLVVFPSSNATAERSFSMLRRLKTYLRSTMSQKRLNHLSILHVHKDEVERLCIEDVMKEFVNRNNYRLSLFGPFKQ